MQEKTLTPDMEDTFKQELNLYAETIKKHKIKPEKIFDMVVKFGEVFDFDIYFDKCDEVIDLLLPDYFNCYDTSNFNY